MQRFSRWFTRREAIRAFGALLFFGAHGVRKALASIPSQAPPASMRIIVSELAPLRIGNRSFFAGFETYISPGPGPQLAATCRRVRLIEGETELGPSELAQVIDRFRFRTRYVGANDALTFIPESGCVGIHGIVPIGEARTELEVVPVGASDPVTIGFNEFVSPFSE